MHKTGGRVDNLFKVAFADNANIGNPKPVRRNLNTKFYKRPHVPDRLPGVEQNANQSL